ncbi:MAG TPA: hypothetical protein VG076_09420 [Acidimicrobiales bacterium]|nr:hypothetical protein [Acidimicrobiales bacterium]
MFRYVRFAAVIAAVAIAASVTAGGDAHGTTTGGVPVGSAVVVRANPDNAVVAAAQRAAATVGFGPVNAVGFSPDCSPLTGRVVVCRNPQLHKKGARAVALAGPDNCVIRADPSVGGAPHGENVLTKAMRKCVLLSPPAPAPAPAAARRHR